MNRRDLILLGKLLPARGMLSLLITLGLALTSAAYADVGTLIPRDKQAPDPAILSLDEMSVEIVLDNGDAHIHIVQIFANHTEKIEEGTYRLALPTAATISDFAVWDGAVRIPAIILERKRAEQVYAQAKLQAIDPGLLEAGDGDAADPRTTAVFTAKIVPIAAYGTKRLELDYHQRLATFDFKQVFVLPLKPDAGQQQTVRHFKLHFVLRSTHSITGLKTPPLLKLAVNDAHTAEGTSEAENLNFGEDFQATWQLTTESADKLEVITHRDPRVPLTLPGSPDAPPAQTISEPGFFEAQWLLAESGSPASASAAEPASSVRTVLCLFDNSLSMQWEKLERSYAALETTLRSLRPGDRFNVLLFNQSVTSFQPVPVPADTATVQKALEFVRASKLRGGTDLTKALSAALVQATENSTVAVFSDGGADRGATVVSAKIASRYAAAWKQVPHPPHTDVFAVGDDANLPLLRAIAHNDGFLEQVFSTEPIDFHLQAWLSKLNRSPVTSLSFEAPAATSLIYPLHDAVYPGSLAQWVGRYQPAPQAAAFTARALRGRAAVSASAQVALPAVDPAHPQLPRLWAQARVDALLAQIDRDGESAASIDEIIRLSRRYKFVTPYTSFLAVPRSLLRPRVIRPGDPVLRVRTDTAITSVIALFPFGLTKPLRHLVSEDRASDDRHARKNGQDDAANRLWETRFLAPPEMKDGTYNVRLILRDTQGNTYNEAKTFVIASTPPTVKLQLSRANVHRGEAVEIKAAASQSTRSLIARLEGVVPVTLYWNPRALTNTGTLVIPAAMPIGRYKLTVTAEDIAHNLGSQEVQIDVLP